MRILITGGMGTLGRFLAKELVARGNDVFSVDVGHGPDEIGFSLRTDVRLPRYARCDVGEFRQLERVFDAAGPFDDRLPPGRRVRALERRGLLRNSSGAPTWSAPRT